MYEKKNGCYIRPCNEVSYQAAYSGKNNVYENNFKFVILTGLYN